MLPPHPTPPHHPPWQVLLCVAQEYENQRSQLETGDILTVYEGKKTSKRINRGTGCPERL